MLGIQAWRRMKYILLFALVVFLSYRARHAQIDDALIYARYINNALSGDGFVFNVGEKVNGLTSPLFCYLLFAVSWILHGNIILASVLISATFLFLASVLAERMVPFAGFLIASVGYFYVQVGMETALFLFMLILTVTLCREEKYNWLPSVLALLVLTRFEGGMMLLVVCAHLFRRRRWPALSSFLPALAIAAGFLLLNYRVYGQILPSSTTAKIGQGLSGALGPWPTAFFGMAWQLDKDFKPTIYFVLAVVALTFVGVKRLRGTALNETVLPFCALLLAFYVLLNVPGYRWYFAPFIFFGLVYGAEGIPRNRVGYSIAAVVLVAVALTNAFVVQRFNETPETDYRVLAEWLNRNTPQEATIEAVETGRLGYYCSHRYIYDVMGLTTPKNADHVTHGDWVSWVAEDKPDYIVMHAPALKWEKAALKDPAYEATPFLYRGVYVLRRKPAQQAANP